MSCITNLFCRFSPIADIYNLKGIHVLSGYYHLQVLSLLTFIFVLNCLCALYPKDKQVGDQYTGAAGRKSWICPTDTHL